MVGKLVNKLLGLFLILFGLWTGLTVLAFASMIDPSLTGPAWWAEYWRGMGRGGGWTSLAFSLVMFASGCRILAQPSDSAANARTKPMPKVRDDEV